MRHRGTVEAACIGALAGLAGTWAMNQAQRGWTRAVEGPPPSSAGGKHDAREWQERTEGRNANEMVAQAIARSALGRPFTRDELAIAAPVVHYGFGMSVAALYGALVDRVRIPAVAAGAALGIGLWLVADEAAMPMLGLSDTPAQRPAESHAQAFAAHLVYGAATEWTRRSLRRGSDLARTPSEEMGYASATLATSIAEAEHEPAFRTTGTTGRPDGHQ